MSSWEAAGATRSTVSASALPGIVSGSPSATGTLGKSSAGSVRTWKREPPQRISTSRSDSRSSISTLSSASERTRSASSRPGSRTVPALSTVAASSVRRPISPSVALSATESSEAATRIPDNAWVAALVDTARETVESLEESSSRSVVSFKDKLPIELI